jgi:hypothetical protein
MEGQNLENPDTNIFLYLLDVTVNLQRGETGQLLELVLEDSVSLT